MWLEISERHSSYIVQQICEIFWQFCAFGDTSINLVHSCSMPLENILDIGTFQITPRVNMAAILQNGCHE